jgi:hypothetical protein
VEEFPGQGLAPNIPTRSSDLLDGPVGLIEVSCLERIENHEYAPSEPDSFEVIIKLDARLLDTFPEAELRQTADSERNSHPSFIFRSSVSIGIKGSQTKFDDLLLEIHFDTLDDTAIKVLESAEEPHDTRSRQLIH